jgi:hypothetical protein
MFNNSDKFPKIGQTIRSIISFGYIREETIYKIKAIREKTLDHIHRPCVLLEVETSRGISGFFSTRFDLVECTCKYRSK